MQWTVQLGPEGAGGELYASFAERASHLPYCFGLFEPSKPHYTEHGIEWRTYALPEGGHLELTFAPVALPPKSLPLDTVSDGHVSLRLIGVRKTPTNKEYLESLTTVITMLCTRGVKFYCDNEAKQAVADHYFDAFTMRPGR